MKTVKVKVRHFKKGFDVRVMGGVLLGCCDGDGDDSVGMVSVISAIDVELTHFSVLFATSGSLFVLF